MMQRSQNVEENWQMNKILKFSVLGADKSEFVTYPWVQNYSLKYNSKRKFQLDSLQFAYKIVFQKSTEVPV